MHDPIHGSGDPCHPGLVDEAGLEAWLSGPTAGTIAAAARHAGDYLILGAGGKMGPTLAMLVRRSLEEAGRKATVYAASRFSDPAARDKLERAGVCSIACDLLDRDALAALPDAPNVLFLAGRKFGSTGEEWTTWAFNVLLPALVAERFQASRIVALSSGNVYPFVPVNSGGCDESTPPRPVGEYAQSVLGRERMFEHFSRKHGTRVALIRLNYAVEPRYGVLVDIAGRIMENTPIDLTMGHVNVIGQRDANAMILRALDIAESPPKPLNVTGPDTLRVHDLAVQLGERLGKAPRFVGKEAPTALLSNAAQAWRVFGPPATPLEETLDAIAQWMLSGGALLGKPTHFEVRDGNF